MVMPAYNMDDDEDPPPPPGFAPIKAPQPVMDDDDADPPPPPGFNPVAAPEGMALPTEEVTARPEPVPSLLGRTALNFRQAAFGGTNQAVLRNQENTMLRTLRAQGQPEAAARYEANRAAYDAQVAAQDEAVPAWNRNGFWAGVASGEGPAALLGQVGGDFTNVLTNPSVMVDKIHGAGRALGWVGNKILPKIVQSAVPQIAERVVPKVVQRVATSAPVRGTLAAGGNQAVVGTAFNPAEQALKVGSGMQEKFSAEELALAPLLGFAMGGTLHGGVEGLRGVLNMFGSFRGGNKAPPEPEEIDAFKAFMAEHGITDPNNVTPEQMTDMFNTLSRGKGAAPEGEPGAVPLPEHPITPSEQDIRHRERARAAGTDRPKPNYEKADDAPPDYDPGFGGEAADPMKDRFFGGDDMAPRTRDDLAGQREAQHVFNQADAQRARVTPNSADTQPAGMPQGPEPVEVTMHGEHPVQEIKRRVNDVDGTLREIVTVQRIDPRTGKPLEGAKPYPVDANDLKKRSYSDNTRMEADLERRRKGPVHVNEKGETIPGEPENPRMPDEGVTRKPKQTYRADTAADDNVDFPGQGEGRSPFPEQPPGEHPGPRMSTAEQIMRDFEERQRTRRQERHDDMGEDDSPDVETPGEQRRTGSRQDERARREAEQAAHEKKVKDDEAKTAEQRRVNERAARSAQEQAKAQAARDTRAAQEARAKREADTKAADEKAKRDEAAATEVRRKIAEERAKQAKAKEDADARKARDAAEAERVHREAAAERARQAAEAVKAEKAAKEKRDAERAERKARDEEHQRRSDEDRKKHSAEMDEIMRKMREDFDRFDREAKERAAKHAKDKAEREARYAREDAEIEARRRAQEEQRRREREQRQRDQQRQQSGGGQRQQSGQQAKQHSRGRDYKVGDENATNTPKAQDKDGRFDIDSRKYVLSDKGGPIKFMDNKQAALWIIRKGQKNERNPTGSPDQFFEVENHPSGQGLTVRERGRAAPESPKPEATKPDPKKTETKTEPPPTKAAEGAREAGSGKTTPGDTRQPHEAPKADERAKAAEKAEAADDVKAAKEAGKDEPGVEEKVDSMADIRNTMYSNPIMDPKIWKMLGGDLKRLYNWLKNSAANFVDDLADSFERFGSRRAPGETFFQKGWDATRKMRTIWGIYQYSLDGRLRQLGGIGMYAKSRQTLHDLADLFNPLSRGGADGAKDQGYHAAFEEKTDQWTARVGKALDKFSTMRRKKMRENLRQIGALVQNPRNIVRGTELGDAAIELQTILKEVYDYLKAAGVDVGQIKNYWPRIVDRHRALHDEKGFLAAATKAYMARKQDGSRGLSHNEAVVAAQDWLERLQTEDWGMGEGSALTKGLGDADPFNHSRSLGPDADAIMGDFFLRSPADVLPAYLNRAVRLAEWSRRLGKRDKTTPVPKGQDAKAWYDHPEGKWEDYKQRLRDEGNGPLIPQVTHIIRQMTGAFGAPKGATGKMRLPLSIARTVQALAFLPLSTIINLTEPMAISVRTGNLFDGPKAYIDMIHQTIPLLRQTAGAKYVRDFATDMGLVGDAYDEVGLMARTGDEGGNENGFARKITSRLFKFNLLTQLTEKNRIVAVKAGMVFMRRLAKDIVDDTPYSNLSRRLLAELGVGKETLTTGHNQPPGRRGANAPKDSVQHFAEWLVSLDKPTKADLDTQGEFGMHYQRALGKFVGETVVRPNRSLKPGWASHPVGGAIFGIASFAYAHQKQVLNRVGAMSEAALNPKSGLNWQERAYAMMPLMMMAPMTAVGWAIVEAKKAYLSSDTQREQTEERERRNPPGLLKKGLEVVSRTGGLGTMDSKVQAATSTKYKSTPWTQILGPTLGTAAETYDDLNAYFGDRNSPNTNHAERKLAQDSYKMIVQPMLETGLGMTLNPRVKVLQGLGTGLLALIAHPQTREYFTRHFAGPRAPDRRAPEPVPQ